MRRHPLDLLSLVGGLLLVALGVAAWNRPLDLGAVRFDLLLPLVVVVIGLSLIVTMRPDRPDAVGEDAGAPTEELEH